MTWGQCMTRCLRDTLSWEVLIILGGSLVGIIEAIGTLIAEYGTWAAAVEAVGAGGIATALGGIVLAIAAVVLLAAIAGCAIHCRRYW